MATSSADMQGLVDGLCSLDHDSAVTVMTSVLQARPELAPAVVSFSVPDLTYPPSKALIERRSTGYIKSFSEEKGFGFIACEELYNTFGNDVFLHHSQLGPFGSGAHVSFAVMLSKDNKPQGYDLMPASKGGGKSGGFGGWDKGGWGDKGSWGMGGWGGGWMDKGSKGAMKGGKGGGALGPGCKGLAKGCQSKGGKSGAEGKRKGGPRPDDSELEQLGQFAGTIKSFNEKNGYGFIDCPELKAQYNNDVFLHSRDLDGHQAGETIEFSAYINSMGKPQAKDVQGAGAAKKQRQEGEFAGGGEGADAWAQSLLG